MNGWKSPQYLQKAFPEELKISVQDTNCLKTSANKSWRVTGERCIIRPAESLPRLVGPSNRVRIWVNKTERLSCLTGRPLKQHATSPWPEQHQALGTDQFYIRDEKEYMFLMGFCSGANQSHKAACGAGASGYRCLSGYFTLKWLYRSKLLFSDTNHDPS